MAHLLPTIFDRLSINMLYSTEKVRKEGEKDKIIRYRARVDYEISRFQRQNASETLT